MAAFWPAFFNLDFSNQILQCFPQPLLGNSNRNRKAGEGMNIFEVNGRFDKAKLAKAVLIPVVGGMVTGILATKNAKKVYRNLKKPDFSPPSWIFPIVWTGLYTMMGIANYRISMKKKPTKTANALYDVQLGLNFLWSFLFFRWGLRGTAFTEIATLLTTITLTTYKFYQKDKTAGSLMVPYIIWVGYAMKLNYSIWQLNKPAGA